MPLAKFATVVARGGGGVAPSPPPLLTKILKKYFQKFKTTVLPLAFPPRTPNPNLPF